MADALNLSDVVQAMMEANAKFYRGWVNLSVEYLRGLTAVLGGTRDATPTTASLEPDAGAIVLEGEAGDTVQGAFLLMNDLGRPLSCKPVATSFRDANGREVVAHIEFAPAAVELQPGEQCVISATTAVDATLDAGVAYSGTIGIKGMKGFTVPAVLRRTHAPTASPIDRAAAEGAVRSQRSARDSRFQPTTGRSRTSGHPVKKRARTKKRPSPATTP